ncbi:MAG TPA: hypothetical protein VK745_17840 [Polyangiaceae bacterium]|jgi:hypothetical protein|nr:hypothetical protein [Polyangiaceae bacterium]
MDQRGPMPPFMRGFVTFMAIAFASTLSLVILQRVHPIGHRAWMFSFYSAGALAGICAWLVGRQPI